MTDNGTPPVTIRWEDPDGSWWIITSDPAQGLSATKFTLVDGDERIVDDVGFGDPRITTLDELSERQVSKYTGRSTGNSARTAWGRYR